MQEEQTNSATEEKSTNERPTIIIDFSSKDSDATTLSSTLDSTTPITTTTNNYTKKQFKLVDSFTYKKKPKTFCGCAMCKIFMNDFPESLDVEDYEPSKIEEIGSILTHGIPFLTFSYMFYANIHVVNTNLEIISAILYCACLLLLVFISTLYHVMCLIYGKQSHKTYWFRIVDYATIYIFIASSYTPFLLIVGVGYENIFGKCLAAFIWFLAICGLIKSFSEGKYLTFITNNALFNLMGWTALIPMPTSMFVHVPLEAYLTLLIGGIFFSGGVFFLKKDGVIPFSHAIWHILSVCGFLMHFVCIYYYIFQLDDFFIPSGPNNSKLAWEQILETFTGERMLFCPWRSNKCY